MLSLEQFKKYISIIKEQQKQNEEYSDAFSILLPDSYVVYTGGDIATRGLINLLSEVMNDQDDWIDWWLYEDVDKIVYLENNQEIDVSSVEDFYKFLVSK